MKTRGIGLAVTLLGGAALLVTGYEVAGILVALGGSFVVLSWHKLLGKLGVRSSR